MRELNCFLFYKPQIYADLHGFVTVNQSLKFYSFFTKIDKQCDSNTICLQLVY